LKIREQGSSLGVKRLDEANVPKIGGNEKERESCAQVESKKKKGEGVKGGGPEMSAKKSRGGETTRARLNRLTTISWGKEVWDIKKRKKERRGSEGKYRGNAAEGTTISE